MSRVGLEPTTYGLKELGSALTDARSRLNTRFDARGRSPAIMGAVTMLVTAAPPGLAIQRGRRARPALPCAESICGWAGT